MVEWMDIGHEGSSHGLNESENKNIFLQPAENWGFYLTRAAAGEHQSARNGAALLYEVSALRPALRQTAVISLLLWLPLPLVCGP